MNTKILTLLGAIFFSIIFFHCSKTNNNMNIKYKAIFLHHSTGKMIWRGDVSKFSYKIFKKGKVLQWIDNYNKANSTNYNIIEQEFPSNEPYGWNNYPYDYYNIWVKNAGSKPYMQEPTIEMLAKEYGLIIWKHCFPVSSIEKETGNPDVNSKEKRIENYKLQYLELKKKMLQFPDTKFLVWTGAALTKEATNPENALRMKQFSEWVVKDWDEENDNIFVWDFYNLETEGGLYVKPEYASPKNNSHPNKYFSNLVAPFFGQRIIDVMSGNGDKTPITGKY
jgi:hypothetical protein